MNVIFKNQGEIDIRSITTFGVSSKEKEDAIGYFGTGLKYAIAILLREGCSVSIYAGEQEYKFDIERSQLRCDEFNFVTMNGEPISFTTELGKNWELWQAYRELYCNCMDEDGEVYTSVKVIPQPNTTKVVVRGGSFVNIHDKREDIIWPHDVNILPKPSNSVFYRGVKVYTSDVPFANSYNIMSSLSLTEDRTLKHEHELRSEISRLVRSSTDKNFIKRAVILNKTVEDGLDYDWTSKSQVFIDTVRELAEDKKLSLNASALKTVQLPIGHDLPKEPTPLSSLNEKKLEKAVEFCEKLSWNISDYPVIVTDKLQVGVMGAAKDNIIYIHPLCFDKGVKYLAATLLEEYLHNKYGYQDETYEFQTHLFDMIISLGEEVNGEPL